MGLDSQSCGFSSSHVQKWYLNHKDGWEPRIDAFKLWGWRRLLRVPWTARRSNQSKRKSTLNIHWKDCAKAEAPILRPPDAKSWLIGKDPDAGKDWRQEKGMTEDVMFGWQHRLNGPEFQQTLGDGEGQGSLVCCSRWGCKESDTTEWLNNHHHHDGAHSANILQTSGPKSFHLC